MTAAIILAAGAGHRLGGVCKAALLLDGQTTFLAAIARAARAGGCSEIVVVCGPPHAGEVRALASALGLRCVENPAPERGMASSIAVGVTALASATDAALIWPVDHPRVRPETVAAVLARAGDRREKIVIPCHAGRGGHPTAFGSAIWPELVAAATVDGGARTVVAAARDRVDRFESDDPGVILDIDLPADLGRLGA